MSRQPPSCEVGLIGLPLCRLHVMQAGTGPPLVMVPATLSELDNWKALVQFMAQWFHVYFFELPGHGLSTPFREEFSSDLVACAVAQLLDRVQANRFNLMGFSFGGILAMKTYSLLRQRIDRLILLAPCLTQRALRLSTCQRFSIDQLNHLLKLQRVRSFLADSMQHADRRHAAAELIHLLGKIENRDQLETKLAVIRQCLIEVVSHEVDEILTAEFCRPEVKYATPCFFAMSIYDPLLDYGITLKELTGHFADVKVTRLFFPFHQPPRPFTFEELNEQFADALHDFVETSSPSAVNEPTCALRTLGA